MEHDVKFLDFVVKALVEKPEDVKILLTHGYSEVLTYSFGNKGEVALVKGLAEDKEKLRTNLSDGLIEAYTKNYYNAPLLGEKVLRMFEFGSVFTKKGEEKKLALIVDDGAKKSSFTEEVEMILGEIKRTLNLTSIEGETTSTKPYCIEINFGQLAGTLAMPLGMGEYPVLTSSLVAYSSISPYPFIVRDIAVWVPESLTFDELLVSINEVLVDDMKLLAKPVALFDSFTKEGRTSYAFRIILQSQEKTLTDEEANGVAGKVYDMLRKKGYEVR
jgi:phenylalanyl-tRNA synthetase beta chain